MSYTITLSHNARQLAAAFRAGQADLLARADSAMARGAVEILREARTRVAKDTTQLTNAVQHSRVGLLEHHVVAAKDYASYLEAGTGPGGRPTLDQMLGWIRRKGITARTPGVSQRSLAHLIRRSIARRGIRPQPFMQPSLVAKASGLDRLLRAALSGGLRAMGGRQ